MAHGNDIIPSVSIIVPVHNTEKFLTECLESIARQTLDNWECIVVVDHSTDGSKAIALDFAARDHRFVVVECKGNGVSAARNEALAKARGRYIAFADSDDYISPDMIETLVTDIQSTGSDIAIVGFDKVYSTHSETGTRFSGKCTLNRDEAVLNIFNDKHITSHLWNKLFKREVITDLFPEGRLYEDYAILVRWFANAAKVSLNPKPCYFYRMRNNSIVNTITTKAAVDCFLAERDRVEFMLKQKVDGLSDAQKKQRLYLAIAKVARDCVRIMPDGEELDALINKIRSLIDSEVLWGSWPVGFKTFHRLWLLKYTPAIFKAIVRKSDHTNRRTRDLIE